MDKEKYIQNRIDKSTNPILKGMWRNALMNSKNRRKKVTWDLYYLYMGFTCNTNKDKRLIEARRRMHNG